MNDRELIAWARAQASRTFTVEDGVIYSASVTRLSGGDVLRLCDLAEMAVDRIATLCADAEGTVTLHDDCEPRCDDCNIHADEAGMDWCGNCGSCHDHCKGDEGCEVTA